MPDPDWMKTMAVLFCMCCVTQHVGAEGECLQNSIAPKNERRLAVAQDQECSPSLVTKTTSGKQILRYSSLCHIPGIRPGAFEQGISQAWSSSRSCPKGRIVSITCAIPDDGKIYEAEFSNSSGDDQFDAECFEAVCSQTALHPTQGGWNIRIRRPTFDFGKKDSWFVPVPKFDGRDVKQCLRWKQSQYPGLSFVLIHRIPLSVLSRYPGLFAEDELVNPENLIEIPFRPEDWDLNHIPVPYAQAIDCFYAHWSQLFKREKVTREEVLDWAKFAERVAKESNPTYIP